MGKVMRKRLAAAGGALVLAFYGSLAAASPASAAVAPAPGATAIGTDAGIMASCRDWTPHIRRVIVANAKVHSSYSGSSSVIATWKYKTLFRIDKRCVKPRV
ncbi:hypothetical protein GCM10027605_41720 [Micromonospora zhanjiangensis]